MFQLHSLVSHQIVHITGHGFKEGPGLVAKWMFPQWSLSVGGPGRSMPGGHQSGGVEWVQEVGASGRERNELSLNRSLYFAAAQTEKPLVCCQGLRPGRRPEMGEEIKSGEPGGPKKA